MHDGWHDKLRIVILLVLLLVRLLLLCGPKLDLLHGVSTMPSWLDLHATVHAAPTAMPWGFP